MVKVPVVPVTALFVVSVNVMVYVPGVTLPGTVHAYGLLVVLDTTTPVLIPE
jgi:hypothetical protein